MSYDLNGNWKFTRYQIQKAKENGISENCLRNRMNNLGWDIERATTEPVGARGNYSPLFSEEEYRQAIINGVSKTLLTVRVKRGWSKEKAIATPVMR